MVSSITAWPEGLGSTPSLSEYSSSCPYAKSGVGHHPWRATCILAFIPAAQEGFYKQLVTHLCLQGLHRIQEKPASKWLTVGPNSSSCLASNSSKITRCFMIFKSPQLSAMGMASANYLVQMFCLYSLFLRNYVCNFTHVLISQFYIFVLIFL